MTRHHLAQRETIHLFRSGVEVVAIITGRKPRHCQGPTLIRLTKTRFAIDCCCPDCGEPVDLTDRYFIVQPMGIAVTSGRIGILHRGGTDLVDVEDLPHQRARNTPVAGVLGISQDFSMEAAFKDALSKLDPQKLSSPSLVQVVSMGALYGGFSGFSRLFVRVEASSPTLRNSKGKI